MARGTDNPPVGTVESDGFRAEGAPLRAAVAWLASHPERSRALIEEAASRFGLSPLDAAVLFRWFGLDCPELYDNKQ